jgi:hypothetical protein
MKINNFIIIYLVNKKYIKGYNNTYLHLLDLLMYSLKKFIFIILIFEKKYYETFQKSCLKYFQ